MIYNYIIGTPASGVTFARSLLERIIEEQTKGDPSKAQDIRAVINREIGSNLAFIKPGSPEAMKLKEVLIQRKMWSQYLEVGLGEDAEVQYIFMYIYIS